MTVARLAQRAENEHVGVACGLMDPFASACGTSAGALLLDCRSLEHRPVPLPLEEIVIVVLDTGTPRQLRASEYDRRRAECENAVEVLSAADPTLTSLRDLTVERLPWAGGLLDPTTFRRVRHVVTENARVQRAVTALEARDLAAVGEAFAESHASLRDDYEVSSTALDTMVAIAGSVPGVVATRMTGAGFGGSAVSLVRPDAVDVLRTTVEGEYPVATGFEPAVCVAHPADGAGMAA
jgi:galactokinase